MDFLQSIDLVVIRVLTYTTLFPNCEMPRHGIFVAERLRHLLASQEIDTTVVAPVPWFPFSANRCGAYGARARVPTKESFEGRELLHPRYPLIPKIGMSVAPGLLAAASYKWIRRHFGDLTAFDMIDAHYFYPDGVAATLLGKWLGKPVVITARGTDINLIPKYRIARSSIRWAMNHAGHMIAVSDALRLRMLELGAEAEKTTTLRNGVDLEKFYPKDKTALRMQLGVTKPMILSVGHLIERKGHHLVIESLRFMPDVELYIVGEGPMGRELSNLAMRMGIADRVKFVGALEHSSLVDYYNAADCLVLCSSREGMANVLLESIACGTPVVASAVWGTPEVISDPAAGRLIGDRTPQAIAEGVTKLLCDYPSQEKTRTFASRFSWEATTRGQLKIFHELSRAQR